MVTPEENDGTVGETVSIEFVKDVADLFVHCSNVVVVLCEVAPDDGGIGIVRRDFDLCWIVDGFLDVPAFAFMRNGDVNDGEKRCVFWAVLVSPVSTPGVPCSEGRVKLVIGLRVIRAIVTGHSEVLGETADVSRRYTLVTPERGPHVHRAEGAGVHSGDNRGTCGGTYRKGDKGICVTAALRGEAVKVWCHGVVIAVTAKVGADIFTTYPQDVGTSERVWLIRRLGR